MDIQLKRGPENKRTTITPKLGEPVFTTDEKELYIGDGATTGGVPVGTVKSSGTIAGNMLALFSDATGKLIKGIAKADFLHGYATESWVNQKIAGDTVNIKINSAKHADEADNAKALNGASDYLRPSVITQSYQESSEGKVVSAKAVKALYNAVVGLINGVRNSKLDKTALSNSTTSTSGTSVASSLAVKTVNDKATQAKTAADSVKQTSVTALSTAQTAINTANTAKSDLTAVKAQASRAETLANANKSRLSHLPNAVTKGVSAPSASTGVDGDVYIQYS